METGPRMNDRWTLSGPHHLEVEIRKSRFRARVAPADNVDAAMVFLEQASDTTANHNCWAYRIGQAYRFSDDGEPGGSAGKPILQAIEGQQLDGVVAVVTRWFGGIKLGVGGLIRAYASTAAECLRQAPHVPIIATQRVRFRVGYPELPLLKARTLEWHLRIDDEAFGPGDVTLTVNVALAHMEQLEHLLADLTRGASTLHRLNTDPA